MTRTQTVRRTAIALSLAAATLVVAAPAHAQTPITKESAAAIRTAFLADLEVMRGKFVGLAQAFPEDKYTWRPMEGVRSVSEVLMLAAMEGYTFIPTSFGGAPAQLGSRDDMAKLRTLTNKAQIIDHLNKGFAHAKQTLEAADPAALANARQVMGASRTLPEVAAMVGGDLHEHLGQLIAYARTNHIVPPWSK